MSIYRLLEQSRRQAWRTCPTATTPTTITTLVPMARAAEDPQLVQAA